MNNSNLLTPYAPTISEIAGLLYQAKRVLFITGAGISVDSGLPTYRGIGGLYNEQLTPDGIPIEELLSHEGLLDYPKRTWKYFQQIAQGNRDVKPNRSHFLLAQFETRLPQVWILMQNVDGLHHAAGSQQVIEIHGNIQRSLCTRCRFRCASNSIDLSILPPKCPECQSLIRPEVVLFGENIPVDQLSIYKREIALGFDLVVSIGTTSVFPYISAPILDAFHKGLPAVEINPDETDVTEFVTHKLPLGASVALQAIWDEFAQL